MPGADASMTAVMAPWQASPKMIFAGIILYTRRRAVDSGSYGISGGLLAQPEKMNASTDAEHARKTKRVGHCRMERKSSVMTWMQTGEVSIGLFVSGRGATQAGGYRHLYGLSPCRSLPASAE